MPRRSQVPLRKELGYCGFVAISHRPDTPEAQQADGNMLVARRLFKGLRALQHRGTEAAGMAFGRHWHGLPQHSHILTVRHLGKVTGLYQKRAAIPGGITTIPHPLTMFDDAAGHEELTQAVTGVHGGVAHVRYTTSGTSRVENTQPFPGWYEQEHPKPTTMLRRVDRNSDFVTVFNGNLTNYYVLLRELEKEDGWRPRTNVDTEVINELIRRGAMKYGSDSEDPPIVAGIKYAMTRLKGAFSCAVYTRQGETAAFRDFMGYRPLVLGHLGQRRVFASETVALDEMEAKYHRDVLPGEIVYVGAKGEEETHRIPRPKGFPTGLQHCIFENIYFAHHNSIINGLPAWFHRARLGAAVAKRALDNIRSADPVLGKRIARAMAGGKTPNDVLVVSTPRSGIPHGAGLAMALRLRVARQPGEDAEIFHRAEAMASDTSLPTAVCAFAGDFAAHPRTRRLVLQRRRDSDRSFILPEDKRLAEVVRKFKLYGSNIKGKHIVLVDDSIVRGTTMKALIQWLRDAGAKSVHLVSAAPPIVASCHMGVAMKTDELVATNALNEEQRARVTKNGGGLEQQLLTALHPRFEAEAREVTGADSVTYIDIPAALRATGLEPKGCTRACTSCFSGAFAHEIDEEAESSATARQRPPRQRVRRARRR